MTTVGAVQREVGRCCVGITYVADPVRTTLWPRTGVGVTGSAARDVTSNRDMGHEFFVQHFINISKAFIDRL